MTTDTTALQERLAIALYNNAEYYGPEDVQPEWEHRGDMEQEEWRQIAAAVLPIIAAEVRKGQGEALRETADWWSANPDDDVFETDKDTRNWLRDVATEYETGDEHDQQSMD